MKLPSLPPPLPLHTRLPCIPPSDRRQHQAHTLARTSLTEAISTATNFYTQTNKPSYSPRGDPLNPEDEEEDEDEEAVATTDEGSTNSARTKQASDGMITKGERCFRGETGEAVGGVGPMLDIADAEDAFPATSVADDVAVEFAAVGVP